MSAVTQTIRQCGGDVFGVVFAGPPPPRGWPTPLLDCHPHSVLTKRIFGLPPELFVLGATAALCASVLLGFKFRHSRLLTRSLPVIFSAAEAAHLSAAAGDARRQRTAGAVRNLVYEGAFRVPPTIVNETSFAYGGTAIAFNAARKSLFIVGHDWHQRVAEIEIPEIRSATSLNRLATATMLQPFTDMTEGKMGRVGPNTVKVGGLLPFKGQLYLSAHSVLRRAPASRWCRTSCPRLDLSVAGDARGPYQVGKIGAGFVSGYFGLVPDAWQEALGGPVLNGNCCLGVISRTSHGPAVFTVDPSRLGVVDPLPATPLVYYPSQHPLADWDATSPLFNGTTEIRGVVFHEADAQRAVLRTPRARDVPATVPARTTEAKAGQRGQKAGVDSGASTRRPSPMERTRNSYSYYVWAYDANDLAAVKAGHKSPWR